MPPTALVIGGTGPTGPSIITGLEERGYRVSMLHTGKHELPELPEQRLEHIHANPNFAESLTEGLAGRSYDLVVASYGRLRLLPEVLGGRTERLISIGGTIYQYPMSRPAREDAPRDVRHKLGARIVEAEAVLMQAHEAGLFNLTHLRYPNFYGPRQLAPREWSVIRRLTDGRRRLPVLDGGRTLESRTYVENAAHAVLVSVDHPEAARGQAYSVVDEDTPSDADRILAIAGALGIDDLELVSFPAALGRPAWYWGIGRDLSWSAEGNGPPTTHFIVSSDKIREQLGYRDLVPFTDAIERTVEWYRQHPLQPGGEEEQQLSDPFDYDAEDAFLAAYDSFAERCGAIQLADIQFKHQYDHPPAQQAEANQTTASQ